MRVKELRRLAELNKDKAIRIYNPDIDNFTVNYHGSPVTIRALEIAEFNADVANHVKKHLADHILNKRGVKSNVEDDLAGIFKEIEVKYD